MDKLLVDVHGTTKIEEFGLAALMQDFDSYAPTVLQDDSYRWWSSELLRRDPENQRPTCTMASDIWALGCTLFKIMSGRLPYFRYQHQLRVWRDIVSGVMPGDQGDILNPGFIEVYTSATSC
ncbi:hypothetical protein ACGC1H_000930 [Rhizoctonia solani]